MKKNDKRLIIIILLIAVICAILFFVRKGGENAVLKIEADGAVFGTYSLNKDQVIEINGTNRLEIKNHQAIMIWADCPDQICVHHQEVSRTGETIVCLPNKVVVSIVDGEKNEFDAVTN